ncbi:hypothetical protein H2200_009514 [Cladophialophora chaetospira]|uniref:Uncharacterized protein n=1 Tax=Cladophialophora chaetospira TaxID=386627 RepID=A0AA38X2S7_9EURO|nr:hypothetical protein H2200_009514 [Cladophialophora chaetospira]
MAVQANIARLSYFILAFISQKSVASPVPEIFPPEPDTLSFAELVHKALSRILALGFFRGVALSLVILVCLTCLLIALLRGLATYLNHYDPKLWETFEEANAFDDDDDDEKDHEDEMMSRRSSICDGRRPYNFRTQQTRSRNSQYILANSPKSVTKINVHASPARGTVILPPSPPPKSRISTPIRSPSTPLRSALSKSPPASQRFSSTQYFLFGSRRTRSSTASSPSPKSVRWADELHVSVISTVELSMRKRRGEELLSNEEAEMDVTTRTIGSRNRLQFPVSDTLCPPAYHEEPLHLDLFPARSADTTKDGGKPSFSAPPMQLEGDTN